MRAEVGLYELGAMLMGHPIARRFALHVDATGENKIHSPDDVLGERFFRLGALAVMEAIEPGAIIMGVKKEVREESLLRTLLSALKASPYLWTEAVRAVIKADLPRHTLSPRLLPTNALWCTFETGINIGGTGEAQGQALAEFIIDAFLFRDYGSGFEVIQFGEVQVNGDDRRPLIDGAHYEYGSVYPDDYLADDGRCGLLTTALAMLAFLNSPFIPREQARASRAARREAARAGEPVEDEVTFVLLRRPDAKRHQVTDVEQSVEWKHRWLVSGHYRAQWYPKDEAHRVIWIAPHIKGPEDAPMIEHAFKVVR